ncbi:MAG: hypothetical protein U1C46_04700 [Bacteroidales bacterium]|nr:hypothetical protein [Bacteroidales bacterium]
MIKRNKLHSTDFDFAQAASQRWLSGAETNGTIDTELKTIFEKLGI